MDGEGKPLSVKAVKPNNSGIAPDPVIHTLIVTCTQCKRAKASSEFHIDDLEKGALVCVACRDVKRMEQMAERGKDVLVQKIAAIQRSSRDKRGVDIPTMAEICGEMMYRFGGLENFCELWHQQIKIACENKAGGKMALDAMSGFAKFFIEIEKTNTARRAVDKLTLEEMQDELQTYIKRLPMEEIIEAAHEDERVG